MNRVQRGTGFFLWWLMAVCSCDAFAENARPGLSRDGLYAEIATTRGVITAELFFKSTPLTVMNFVGLAEGTLGPQPGKRFYDGLVFHRIVPGFVVQGGDPLGRGEGGPGYTFSDEFVPGLSHDAAGVLSMANMGPDSNGSQFFFTLAPVVRLDYLHSVFGRVVVGLDVLPLIQPGDTMNVRIRRVGNDAESFPATPALFAALSADIAKKRKARSVSASERPMFFEDPDGLLPSEPPRARAFNSKLSAFEAVTGRRIFVRLLAKMPAEKAGQKLGAFAKDTAENLGATHDGILVTYVADRNEWKLWIGESLLPLVMGRPGKMDEYMRNGELHARKEALLADAKRRLSAPPDPSESSAQRLKLACDDVLAALIHALVPKDLASSPAALPKPTPKTGAEPAQEAVAKP